MSVAHQALLSMGYPRHKYWSGLSFLSPGNLPPQELNQCLLHWRADSLPLSHPSPTLKKKKIMASGHMTSWQIDGETMETVRDFIFLGSNITAEGDCSHEIKRPLLLGRKALTNLDSILKSRDFTLPTKIHLSQRYGFSSGQG